MTEQLKPCPFCGDTRIKLYGGGLSQEAPVTICTGCYTQVIGHKLWNNRPVENKIKADAVRESVADVGTNEPFARIVIDHVKDYADKLERGE